MGCTQAPEACPEFDAAQAAYVEASAKTTSRPFQDPAYASIAASFEALPETCPRFDIAVQLAADLRANIERHRLEEQRAVAAAADRAEQEEKAKAAVRRAAEQQCRDKVTERYDRCVMSCRAYNVRQYCFDRCTARSAVGRKACSSAPRYAPPYR